jgi:hypothetical protein
MRRFLLGLLLCLAAGLALWAQRSRFVEPPPFEVKTVLPLEVSPARYQQVDQRDLERLANDGWELVAVTPYVYLNEERGHEPKAAVTQTYPAYFFKRPKLATMR